MLPGPKVLALTFNPLIIIELILSVPVISYCTVMVLVATVKLALVISAPVTITEPVPASIS